MRLLMGIHVSAFRPMGLLCNTYVDFRHLCSSYDVYANYLAIDGSEGIEIVLLMSTLVGCHCCPWLEPVLC